MKYLLSGFFLLWSALTYAQDDVTTVNEAKALGGTLQTGAKTSANPGSGTSGSLFSGTTGSGTTTTTGGAGHTRGFEGEAAYSGQTARLNCSGEPVFLGGIGVKANTCQENEGLVTSANISVCTVSRNGSTCGLEDWSGGRNLAPGGNATFFNKYTVGLDCTNQPPCLLTLGEKDGFAYREEEMLTKAQDQISSAGEGSIYQGMQQTYTDGNYRAQLAATGSQQGACIQQIHSGLTGDGLIYSCDGEKNASFDPLCETTVQCLETTRTVTTYTDQCETDVELLKEDCETNTTTGVCENTLEKGNFTCDNTRLVTTRQCSLTADKQTQTCNNKLTSTVTRNYNAWTCSAGQQLGSEYSYTVSGRPRSIRLRLVCDTNNRIRVETNFNMWCDPNPPTRNSYLSQSANPTIVTRGEIDLSGTEQMRWKERGGQHRGRVSTQFAKYDGVFPGGNPQDMYQSGNLNVQLQKGDWNGNFIGMELYNPATRARRDIPPLEVGAYSKSGDNVVRPDILTAISRYRRSCYLWFSNANCSGGSCTFNFRWADEYWADDSYYPDQHKIASFTFPAPVQTTITDSWSDNCGSFK